MLETGLLFLLWAFQSCHFMANRWGKMKTVADFIFLGSIITVDSDCSHKIKRRLLLERKAMTNLDSVLKIIDITWPTKVCLVKAMVLPVQIRNFFTTFTCTDVRVGP